MNDDKLKLELLRELNSKSEGESSQELIFAALLRGELVKTAASMPFDTVSFDPREMFPWHRDLVISLNSCEELLQVMTKVRKQSESTKLEIPWQHYFPCERLFGLHRKTGMCIIQNVDRCLLYYILQITQMSPEPETSFSDAAGIQVLVFDPADNFHPALTYLLSCKRLELLYLASDQIRNACTAVESQNTGKLKQQEVELRWKLMHIWIVILRSRAEGWHSRNGKLFESNHQLSYPRPKLLGHTYWTGQLQSVLGELVSLLVSKASDGTSVKIKDVFSGMPTENLSVVRKELQSHALKLLVTWHRSRAVDKSAKVLSVSLYILQFCGFEMLRDLAATASKTADGSVWHPPLLQTGISDLRSYLHFQRSGLALTSSMSSVKYLLLHLNREPPVDTWPMLECALAEASIALSLLVGQSGLSPQHF